jgi:hypothetical protein
MLTDDVDSTFDTVVAEAIEAALQQDEIRLTCKRVNCDEQELRAVAERSRSEIRRAARGELAELTKVEEELARISDDLLQADDHLADERARFRTRDEELLADLASALNTAGARRDPSRDAELSAVLNQLRATRRAPSPEQTDRLVSAAAAPDNGSTEGSAQKLESSGRIRGAVEALTTHRHDWERRQADARKEVAPMLATDAVAQTIEHRRQDILKDLRRSVLERGVLPLLRTALGEQFRKVYDMRLPASVTAPGLSQLRNPDHEIPTAARARVQGLLDRMDAGSVGIAGPRGSGKTTLISHFCDPGDTTDPTVTDNHLRLMVSAPVEYVPREFLLHLFATLCRLVVRKATGRDADELLQTHPGTRQRWRLASLLIPIVNAAAGVIGIALVVTHLVGRGLDTEAARRGSGAGLAAAAAVLLLYTLAGSGIRGWPLKPITEETVQTLGKKDSSAGAALGSRDRWARSDLTRWLPLIVVLGVGGATVALLANASWWSSKTTGGLWLVVVGAILLLGAKLQLGQVAARIALTSRGKRRDARRTRSLLTIANAGILAVAEAGLLLAIWGLVLIGLAQLDIAMGMRYVTGLILVTASIVLAPSLRSLRGGIASLDPEPDTLLLQAAPSEGIPRLTPDAVDWLRRIKFQQTFTSGWSGTLKALASLKLPAAFDIQMTESTALARQQMTYPEIVDEFKAFAREATRAARGKLYIGIDELDKMESDETARKFLSDIKAVFGVEDCFYLVSISEDAVAGFEARGLPFRDVFDSSFDEVVKVGYLDLASTRELLTKRVTGLPVPFVCLCHCLSGGLARDLIRVARNLFETRGTRDDVAVVQLCRDMLEGEQLAKTEAVATTIKSTKLDREVSQLLAWFDELRTPERSMHQLLLQRRQEVGSGATVPAVDCHPKLTEPDEAKQDSEAWQTLLRLGGELAGFYYYCATVLEFFADLDDERLRQAEAPGERSLDRLVESRQAFTLNGQRAWKYVSAFRAAWNWEVLPFPTTLVEAATSEPSASPDPLTSNVRS